MPTHRNLLSLYTRAAVFLIFTSQATTWAAPVETDLHAMIYLSQFGYLNPQVRNINSGALMSAEMMKKAISEFQAFAGLNVTGELDSETSETMSLPRCGVSDVVGYASDSRTKRFALQGSRWKVKELTYKISKYPYDLKENMVEEEIQKALDVWAGVTPLIFVKKSKGSVHIEVRFEKGEHGDGDPFDGPGGTLAHAFYPFKGGDAHFDGAETWTIGTSRGTNLFQAAVHEFGHALGLSHSDVRTSLMAPFYRGYEPHLKLDVDDILGIQSLYGKKPQSDVNNTKESPKPSVKEDPELCKDASIDAAFNSSDGYTYVFKGQNYWRLAEMGTAPGYPRLISKSWPGLPGYIDAAITHQNGKTYFFKGSQYWRYVGKKMDGDYPKLISDGFPGIPDDIDAALIWGGNGKFYFFKGSKFWRFDPTHKPPVKKTYPKPISSWDGVPDNLDAVLQYDNGYTYFFKDGEYYRFDDFSFSVDVADPPFPRPAGFWWFGCKSEEKGKLTSVSKRVRGDDLDLDSTDVDDIILDADDARSQPTDEMAAAVKDRARNLVLNEVLVAAMIAASSVFWYISKTF